MEVASVPRTNIEVIRTASATLAQRWDAVSPLADSSTLYDLLHDAKRRLTAAIYDEVRGTARVEDAIVIMRAVRDDVEAVSLDDLEAQRRLRDDLHRRAAELERQHELDDLKRNAPGLRA